MSVVQGHRWSLVRDQHRNSDRINLDAVLRGLDGIQCYVSANEQICSLYTPGLKRIPSLFPHSEQAATASTPRES